MLFARIRKYTLSTLKLIEEAILQRGLYHQLSHSIIICSGLIIHTQLHHLTAQRFQLGITAARVLKNDHAVYVAGLPLISILRSIYRIRKKSNTLDVRHLRGFYDQSGPSYTSPSITAAREEEANLACRVCMSGRCHYGWNMNELFEMFCHSSVFATNGLSDERDRKTRCHSSCFRCFPIYRDLKVSSRSTKKAPYEVCSRLFRRLHFLPADCFNR